ncbi:hypothetical protein PB2503_10734 [Parvularcula bermudensis HTCC2503]|uniref:4'-phosphopantetheinyl transferase domain-containing protein n=1 Tax=Parvularcula bermudensis (strain ATCC BAA-594 / HTCC2503 / KCTC 12087) TaxID=314260 RepID=E0THA8_PARBH|nr:4'-phosphopantetheinyl transferase superfamily protein [Parvularcula bermudensis]ADM10198.1 hypothetical protein PB2503_10734 [Parvularcula bermudensis HTCC2503]
MKEKGLFDKGVGSVRAAKGLFVQQITVRLFDLDESPQPSGGPGERGTRPQCRQRSGRALRQYELACAYGCRPEAVELKGGRALLPGGGSPAVSYTRSGRFALFAFADHGPLGIDLEAFDGVPDEEIPSLARDHLAPAAAAEIEAAGSQGAKRSFLFHWTAMEAVGKAARTGLAIAHRSGALSATARGLAVWHRVPRIGYMAALAAAPGARVTWRGAASLPVTV